MQRRLAFALAVLAAVPVLGACGGTSAPIDPARAERIWLDNARQVVEQLRGDLTLSKTAGDGVVDARAALHSDSDLYALLLAYTDFGGCRHMVGSLGAPSPRFRRVERTFASVCLHLQRSAGLFTRATSRDDPRLLLAASREAARASPLLVRAAFQLRRAPRRHPSQ